MSTLDSVSQARYIEKLHIDGKPIPDPYTIENWTEDMTLWPNIMYGHVYNYVINTPGIYTKEAMESYTSLEGYNFLESGKVREVFYNEVSKESTACLLKAKVNPSQRQNDQPHEAWALVDKKNAYIITAHCTCKAGYVFLHHFNEFLHVIINVSVIATAFYYINQLP